MRRSRRRRLARQSAAKLPGGLAILNGAACDPARSPVVRLNMRDVSGTHVGSCTARDHRPAVDSDQSRLRRRGSDAVRVWLGIPADPEIVAQSFVTWPNFVLQHSVQLRRGRDHDGRGPGTHAGLDPDEPRWRRRRNGHSRRAGEGRRCRNHKLASGQHGPVSRDERSLADHLRATVQLGVFRRFRRAPFPASAECGRRQASRLRRPSLRATMGRTFTSRCAIPASLRLFVQHVPAVGQR